ncbi:hypothetical protein CVIRNUC_007534 [Coccomyxa viridis]|uniref:Telomeric single stranded DNA binding POT1/Cdc13 domain-containing protein n=1 Tax=Coccomyxa viridis TaxID=1274662 RepID=A0AAV1ICX3_9CHLO|nr:hypothetical protein CVIRNUC_007534 [Coccomyxa viridis]
MLLANPPHEAQGSPNAASSNRDPSLPQYSYRTLLDVVQNFTPGLWHFYALITECSVPRPTSKDWMCNMRVVDPSVIGHPGFPNGVEILFFAPREADLPRPGCVDHIIRLHRCTVQEYNGRAQFLGRVGRGRPCQFCMFARHAEPAEERIAPLYSSASQYTMSEQEENIVRLLRNALQEGSVQDAGGTYMRQIRDLDPPHMVSVNQEGSSRANTFFDICCKVLHVEGQRNAKTLYVWDGSDARPFPYRADRREAFVGENGLDAAQHAALMALTPKELPTQALAGAPRMGSVLPVVQYSMANLPREVPVPAAGSWVKLRNLAATLVDGQLQGLMLKSSKWAPYTPPLEMLQALEERCAGPGMAEWAPTRHGLWTWTQQTQRPFETLREVQQAAAANGKQRLHRCLARVVDYSLLEGGGLTSTPAQLGRAPGTSAGDHEEHTWAFRLHLQDATASIVANVSAIDGDAFFTVDKDGQQVQKLTASYAAQNRNCMIKVLEALMGTCSLHLDRGDPVGSRIYRICDTQMTRTVDEAIAADAA